MKIKLKIFLSLIFAANAFLSSAQLAMSLKMNRSNYLQYEIVYAKVNIRNNSGHAVIFGDNKRLKGRLLFKIIDRDHNPVNIFNEEQSYPMEGVIIEAGQSKEFVVPISRFYDLKKCNTYRMYAFVEHNMFEDLYRSNDVTFEVNKGMVAWEKTVGIPEFMSPGKKGKVAKRNYKLVTLAEGSQKSNYLMIDDEKRVYSVIFLSYELGEERITHEIDEISRLHLLVPMSPKIFVYLIVDINGKIDEESVYKRTQSIPALVRAPDNGKIYITGGAKAKKDIDYK
ncbi:MAG: hypothetical protein PHV82_11270 [Victivallaceae bacterium]|nr:hypothetical protein [Victivallaceae bacterium]